MSTTTQRLTLEEYLNYDGSEDTRYELVAGELVEIPPKSPRNVRIGTFLLVQLLQFVSINQLTNKAEIVVSGFRATTRIPDLMVLSNELVEAMEQTKRSTILLDMPPPLLVVEVVSPGTENHNRDYRYKPSEYAARGIAEYWIIDPEQAQVTILTLVDGLYEDTVFQNTKKIQSSIFPQLNLTVEQLLNPSL
jgi:Uma2 family endonuclease